MSFMLYQTEVPGILPFDDYGTLLRLAAGRSSVLEFGPGYSTLAFIEAGCQTIVTCEYSPQWLTKAVAMFRDYPQVTVLPFANTKHINVPGISDTDRFDLALVDSPVGVGSGYLKHDGYEDMPRLNTLLYALDHAPVVLLHDARRPGEQRTLQYIKELGYVVTPHITRLGLAEIRRPPG